MGKERPLPGKATIAKIPIPRIMGEKITVKTILNYTQPGMYNTLNENQVLAVNLITTPWLDMGSVE